MEVNINFRINSRGIFDIIEPVLEEGEVFDSSLLRETINSQIAMGKRNFAIDLALLDYVYSDTINVLMGLNKRILDVSGRLSLLSPQPEALQVLKRAGIHNILRIFDSEADLLKTSEDIILQTTSFKVSDLQAMANEIQPPQSEFDQLRSEIGSVFGSHDVDVHTSETPSEHVVNRPPIQPHHQNNATQRPAQRPVDVTSSVNDEFNQAFNNYDQSGQNSFPPIPQPAPFKSSTLIPPVQPQFQGRQYVPPSPVPQTRFDSVPKNPSRGFIPPEPPKATPDFSTSRTETQRFQTMPGSVVRPSLKNDPIGPPTQPINDDYHDFSPPSQSKKSKGSDIIDNFDGDDDFDENIKKKKSRLPILIIIILVVAAGVGIAYYVFSQLNVKPNIVTPAVTKPATVQTPQPVPQVPVVDSTISTPAPEVVKPEIKKPVTQTPTQTQRVVKPKTTTSTQKPVVRSSTPAAVSNNIIITSIPSGASVDINGEVLGTTPYTWSKPVFGMVNVTVRKSGYEENSISFEFTGGSTRKSISLEKVEAVSAPAPARQPVVAELVTPPPPLDVTPEPVIPPPASSPAENSVGGDASIFIASIPPVADVYLNGKLVGKTNVSELKLPSGTHTLRFVKGTKEVTKEISVKSGKNPSQMVRLP